MKNQKKVQNLKNGDSSILYQLSSSNKYFNSLENFNAKDNNKSF